MMKSTLVPALMMILALLVCGCTDRSIAAGNNNKTVQDLQQSPAPERAEQTTPRTPGNTSGSNGEQKILVAYFSHSGNTRVLANRIHEIAGGDIFEITTVDPYPTDYEAVKARAKQELGEGYRPRLAATVGNMSTYDVVFVGYPIWWGTKPMAVDSFLTGYDVSGKTIIPFSTHEGSGLGRSVEDIRVLCPDSTVLDGLAIRGGTVNTAQNQVSDWLRGIGYSKKEIP